MKVTRKSSTTKSSTVPKKRQGNRKINQVKPPKYRPARRYIKPTNRVTYTDLNDNTLNNPQTFTYMDYNRNKGMVDLVRKHYEDIIRMYGIDFAYFRKFNTFFQDEENNKSNLIYGEDTTAEYYISGLVRGFLSIDNYNWQFNMMRIRNYRNNYH